MIPRAPPTGFPRYASITFGSSDSRGAPRAITCPKSITISRFADPHHQAHLVLDQQYGQGEPLPDPENELHERFHRKGFIPAAGSSSRRNCGGQCREGGDLQPAGRRTAGFSRSTVLEGKDREIFLDLLPCPPLLPVERTGPEKGVGGVRTDVRVVRDPHVIHHRQIPEEADVLEGPCDPRRVISCGGRPVMSPLLHRDGAAIRAVDSGDHALNSVVFPEPLGPMIPAIWSRSRRKSTPSRALIPRSTG